MSSNRLPKKRRLQTRTIVLDTSGMDPDRVLANALAVIARADAAPDVAAALAELSCRFAAVIASVRRLRSLGVTVSAPTIDVEWVTSG